jgi:hypothetical protein
MLELRPSCECCDKDLPPSAADAMICTFECTFCRDCVEKRAQFARSWPGRGETAQSAILPGTARPRL